jgi:N-acyl-D-amino-acid deacylase
VQKSHDISLLVQVGPASPIAMPMSAASLKTLETCLDIPETSRVRIQSALFSLLLLSVGGPAFASEPETFDLLIRNARILDGTGNPWRLGDVGVRDGRIARLGRGLAGTADEIVDARGRYLTPGFIDLHSHADDAFDPENGLRSLDPRRRAAPNLVSQGITTVVVNQDGRSPLPIGEQRDRLIELGTGPNVALLVGHGSVRQRVLGAAFRREATPSEIERMRELIREAMEEGAFGLSAGLEYAPGRWSATEELIQCVLEIEPFDGLLISHQRSEGVDPMWFWPSRDDAAHAPSLLDAVAESIEIAEKTGVTVVATHIKAKGVRFWGASLAVAQMIERARERGVRIWADQYPYESSGSDGNVVLVPPWAFEASFNGYADAVEKVLQDPIRAAKLRQDIAHEIDRRGGPDRIFILASADDSQIGKSLQELAEARSVEAVEAALLLQREGFPDWPGGARLRGFSLSAIDLKTYARQPWMATASDAGIALPGDSLVHPRFYGAFPRTIRTLALDQKVLTPSDAVRGMTSLPALILGLHDRGVIREGAVADLVLMDFDELRDEATFSEPHRYASGIPYVWINGSAVVRDGVATHALPGRVLQKKTNRSER